MTLRVAILRGELLETGELVAMLQAGGAEVTLLAELPPENDPTIHLVLLDRELQSRHGQTLLGRVRERFPEGLVCLLAPFAHHSLQAGSLPTGLWDVLYLPAQSDEVDDLLSRTEVFVERRVTTGRPKEILIVDDEESLREVTAALIEQRGYRPETAVDALEAIGKLLQRPFDLVITDLQMPGIDGMALLGRIRGAYPQLPVVISTGHATVDTAIAALRTGAVDFIRKPFTAADFTQVIERALRFGELSRANLELEQQAREEKSRLRERQYQLRVLATAIAEMSRSVMPAQVAECWLHAAGQVLNFTCGAFFLPQPDPELVLFDRCAGESDPAGLLLLLGEQAPGLVAGVSPEGVRVRRLEGSRRTEPAKSRGKAPAQVHVFGPAENACAGVVLLGTNEEGPTALQKSFLNSLSAPAAQVLEKLRALAGESRLREAAMVAGMHQGVILADLEGRILVINQAARELLGLTPEEPVTSLAQLSAARAVPLEAAVDELKRGGETLRREFPLAHPAERILTVDLTLIHGGSGEPIAVVGLLQDITELRESERMKTEFVAIVSHELRTPLTTIKNCNSLILSGSTGPVSPPQERFLNMAKVSIDRITRLVNDLLDVAKIESGRLNLECAMFDLAELLHEVGNETEHLLTERELRMTFTGLDDPLVILADRDRIKQVFFNLVHNAVKFSPDGGLITVLGRTVAADSLPPAVRAQLLASPDDTLVEVQVIDEGVGLAAEDLERIFERFQQVEMTLRREHGGLGLGLPISRGIVRSHGGEILAEPRKGGGSVFRVVLPHTAVETSSPGGPAGDDEDTLPG